MASLQVNLSTGEVGMAGGGGYFSSNVAVSGVQIADANGDLTNITANTVFASNLNVTGDFVKVTQSAGASGSQPALTINQETSGDILQLQRSGAAKLTVLENGNLGIGTAVPQSALHVIGSARVDGNALIGDSVTADAHTVLGSASLTYSGTSTALTVNQQGTGKLFEVQDAGTARMTILDGGFVGIGTATPQSALHVIGSASVSSNLVVSGNITATGLLTASNLRVLGDYVILDTISSNTEQMVITNDGTGPALKVTQTGANSIAEFYDDGNALAFKVANDGLIGIGTATPQAKLHVVGSVKATTSISSDTQFLGQAADTASAPSFSFAADPNTGVFQPAASNIAVTTGGTERMRVLANGNVGIGTTDPLRMFHVQGNNAIWRLDRDANAVGLQFHRFPTGDFTTPWKGFVVGVDATDVNTGTFFINDYGTNVSGPSTGRLRINNVGNIGIGTDVPTQKLHVQGNILSSGSTSAGTQFMGLATDLVTTPSYSWTDDSNTGMYHPGADKLGLVTAGVERVSVLANGNVGIGTTNPRAKLDVNDTGAMIVPSGTTAEQPSTPIIGMLRFNTTTNRLQYYNPYGWASVGGVSAQGGNSISDVNGYRIHVFTSSGTLTVYSGGVVEYLVVAGGGGGGGYNGAAGGGAGGMLFGTQTILSSQYGVTIGSGGTGSPGNGVIATSGNSSSFNSIVASGGGYGATQGQSPDSGGSGGSGGGGGGAGGYATLGGSGGTGISGQGNNGGRGWYENVKDGGGGGGGRNAAGGNASSNKGGTGGDGLAWINGNTYAGGGGGGSYDGSFTNGGAGGGGRGGNSVNQGLVGSANTGGGGGGGTSGGAGGSGIVIIRYLL